MSGKSPYTGTGIGELSPIEQSTRNLGRLSTCCLDLAASLGVPADFLAWGGGEGTISSTITESSPAWRAVTTLTIESGLIELIAGITNIADRGPPVIGGAASVTNPGTCDIIGRTLFAGLKARF